jgi:hypothetical protein
MDHPKQLEEVLKETDDPVIAMLGVGKQIWEKESGDDFIARLRAEIPDTFSQMQQHEASTEGLNERIWERIEHHQGQEFRTSRGLPFTYEVDGAGIWFWRNGRRINRKLTRTQVDVAISRCPLASTTEIKDLMDFAYLYALLMDRRIRNEAW